MKNDDSDVDIDSEGYDETDAEIDDALSGGECPFCCGDPSIDCPACDEGGYADCLMDLDERDGLLR